MEDCLGIDYKSKEEEKIKGTGRPRRQKTEHREWEAERHEFEGFLSIQESKETKKKTHFGDRGVASFRSSLLLPSFPLYFL